MTWAPPAGTEALVAAIHATETRAVLAVTGGGVGALSWLLGVPGASRTVLEASVPYADAALEQLMGHPPDQAVSATTAADMAAACLRRAVTLTRLDHPPRVEMHAASPSQSAESTSIPPGPSPTRSVQTATEGVISGGDEPLIGVSATAALVSDRPKRGEHRAHVGLAWRDGSAFGHPGAGQAVWSLRLAKGARDRNGEDGLVSALVIAVLAYGSGLRSDGPSTTSARPRLLAEDLIEPAWPV